MQSVSVQQMSILNKFEEEFISYIKVVMVEPQFALLRVAPSFTLQKRGTTTVQLVSNASFSIPNSNSVLSKVTQWVSEYEEIGVYIPDFTLKIELCFRVAEKDDTNDATAKDLPIFTLTTPTEKLENVILPEQTKKRIYDDLRAMTHIDLIYKQWGFEEIDPTPRLVLSFYGKPGTGKTMLANAIANYFGKTLLASNYSEIESKYVGESAKNLEHAFKTAKENDAVLFFDEADSFLGKRIQNVEHGSEQAINSLRSQMLILLEQHSGIVIFATNLVSNFDKAFESRFLDSIEIPMPNKEARAEIIKKKIPSKLPFRLQPRQEDFLNAAEICDGIAGREIKNAILRMLLTKAEIANYQFCPEDIIDAMKDKMKELEKLHQEIENQKKGIGHSNNKDIKEIKASPEQLEGIKDAIKDNLKEAKEVKM